MHIHEFELRYRAYKGLCYKFGLGWDQDTILEMIKISDQGVLTKPVQEIKPEELHEITLDTYTQHKKQYIEANKDIPLIAIGGEKSFGTMGEYINRLEYELKVIKEMGFNSYFLIVADFVRWAKKNMIVVGPGRGSGAGSILAWVIRITDIDPLQFGLLFERFLNPARISMPDFDIDFEDVQREKVVQYVKEKYGQDKVCSIGTYMQLASKAAFKDVARVLGVPFEKSNQISGLMPDKMSLLQAVQSQDVGEELKALYEGDAKIQQAAELSEKLQGNMRQLGMHACGIIIAPEKITKYSPVQYTKEGDTTIISQYDGPTLETIGLLKMDFLGLRNLSVIKNCIKIIQKKQEKEGKELPEMFSRFFEDTSFQPPLEDPFTFQKVFQIGNTTGIFQFESSGMRKFLIKLKADSINDLVAMNALYRPGPMEFIPNYIARKNGEEPISYMSAELREMLVKKHGEEETDKENIKLVEDLAPIMNLTYGIAVYQEQLMFLVQSMAGFSLAEADLLRRGVGKKKKEIIEQIKKEFTKRAKEYREYKKETAIYIYEKMIEPAASYSFNKSHSVCYAMIAYQTAYLKAYYPVEFYASLIRSVEEDTDELSLYISEAQNQGILVLPPHINQSFNHVAAIGNEIRLGFFCIKGLGLEIGEVIQEERTKNGPYQTLEDFIKRCAPIVNKKSAEGLIKSGAFDEFGDRGILLANSETILERAKKSKDSGTGLFGMMEMSSKMTLKQVPVATVIEKLMMEYEVFKVFVSGNLLDGLYLYIKRYNFISQFKEKENFGNFVIVGYIKNIQRAKKKGFFIQIEDISGTTEIFVREVLDFKRFDILVITGFKGRSISIEKIVKVSRDQLIKQSGSKYSSEMTVVKAKLLRLQSTGEEQGGGEIKSEANIAKEISPTSPQTTFVLPDNIQKINEIITLTQTHKGDQEITISNKTFLLNEEGIQKIHALLTK
ncbi:MAG: DNA polymerase III subunit alpha [Candidatus Absconditabacterales bacterium]